MRFAMFGSGAVGGYYGAKLVRAGEDVTFIARGAHLQAIREHGLTINGPLGNFTIRARAEQDTRNIPPVDVVVFAVKTYDNPASLPALASLMKTDGSTAVLTLQNGVDSVDEIARIVGDRSVLGGCTYIAAALVAPGVIEQTGTHRRIIFGEVFGERTRVSERVERLCSTLTAADIHAEAVADARAPIWEKFIYLSPFAGFTGAARQPIGPLWTDPAAREMLLDASREVAAVARAEGVSVPDDYRGRLVAYLDSIPASTRSSLLIDLQQGKRIEVEALQGAAVRRGRAVGVPTPIMATLYAVLKLYANGAV